MIYIQKSNLINSKAIIKINYYLNLNSSRFQLKSQFIVLYKSSETAY